MRDCYHEPELLDKTHCKTKKMNGRGSLTQSHLAAVAYLKQLEAELKQVQDHLNEAWIWLDGSKDFRRCSRHADHAQQRLHKVIKKIQRAK